MYVCMTLISEVPACFFGCSNGVLALASCSSHIGFPLFHQICDAAISKARRTAAVLGVHGQPADHPYPAVCSELRYLKFITYLLD
jgi:23S rRNA (cytosine1962-C5)-methyltransferase